MKTALLAMTVLMGAAAAALLAWRWADSRADEAAWRALADAAGGVPDRFDPAVVADLPEPARRYFTYTLAPGAPLHQAIVLDMEGELGLGTRERPDYRPMTARQILAPPHGLVWRLKAGLITGSDAALPGRSWTRFWLGHLLPVVRISGQPDHHRSAFGRVVAEAAFWAPATLLPANGVIWEEAGPDTARATVSFGGFTQTVEVTVAPDGQPTHVVIDRWSNENADATYRWQPFGGTLSEFRNFDGHRLPTRVEGGNHFGTPDYFPFFRASVTDVSFPDR